MKIISGFFLKRIFAITLTLLVGAPGVVGVYITLFHPNVAQLSLSVIFMGLISSFIFLLMAWIIWRWSKTCLLCRTNQSSRELHH